MSSPVILRHLDAARFDEAAALLAGLHPVDEASLRDAFARTGAAFEAFWDLSARTRAAEIVTGSRDAIRSLLRAALVAIAQRQEWALPRGLAAPIHAIVGVDPQRFHALYRLSGGALSPRDRAAQAPAGEDVARILDAPRDLELDVDVPARCAIEPDERGLVGAWSSDALDEILPLLGSADERATLDTILAQRQSGWWARLSGEAERCARVREGLEESWAEWERIVEAVRATTARRGYLGVETR